MSQVRTLFAGYMDSRKEEDLNAHYLIWGWRDGLVVAVAPTAIDCLTRLTVKIGPRTWILTELNSAPREYAGMVRSLWGLNRAGGSFSSRGAVSLLRAIPFHRRSHQLRWGCCPGSIRVLQPSVPPLGDLFRPGPPGKAFGCPHISRCFNLVADAPRQLDEFSLEPASHPGTQWRLAAGWPGSVARRRSDPGGASTVVFHPRRQLRPVLARDSVRLSGPVLGVFPTWTPLQLLGGPLAEIGTYALTYPFTYLSYFIAEFLLGNKNLTMEIFCWMHLLAGFSGRLLAGPTAGSVATVGVGLGLCLALSGFALIGGRSWYYMTPAFVWVPLLSIALLKLQTRVPSWRWTLGTGLVIGLFFHAGNAQMWVYAMGFTAFFVLWSCLVRLMPWGRLLAAVPAGLIGMGLAAPLLVPQSLATRELNREGGGGSDVAKGGLRSLSPIRCPLLTASRRKGDVTTRSISRNSSPPARSSASSGWL